MTEKKITKIEYFCDGCYNKKPKYFLHKCFVCDNDFCADCRFVISEYQKTERKYSGKLVIVDYICKTCKGWGTKQTERD